jgi:hypothetical protein
MQVEQNRLGWLEFVGPALTALVQAGGQIGGSMITANAQKRVESSRASVERAGLDLQAKQLELQTLLSAPRGSTITNGVLHLPEGNASGTMNFITQYKIPLMIGAALLILKR